MIQFANMAASRKHPPDSIFFCSVSPNTGIGPPKKSFVGTPPPNGCPICGVQLSPSDLETHFSAELTRLTKMTSHAERIELRRTLSVDMHTVQNNLQGRTSRWEVRWTLTHTHFEVT